MKLIIDIPKEKLNIIKNKMYCGIYDSDLYKTIENGTPIPDNATNGDVIKAMFPDSWQKIYDIYCLVERTISEWR